MVAKRASKNAARIGGAKVHRGRGRPRREDVDENILRAALAILSEGGFASMSMDAVAERAGVSKPTIYRRWSTKIELATACVPLLLRDDPVTTESDVWKALRIEIWLFWRAVEKDHAINIIGTLLAHEEQQPTLIAEYRENVAAVRRARVRAIFDRGIATGQLPHDVDVNLALNMLLGFYYASYIGGDPQPLDWPDKCVELLRRSVTGVQSPDDPDERRVRP
jgi:AcrR family transcriptional regulator